MKPRISLPLLSLFACLVVTQKTEGATLRVPADYPTVQGAINAALSGDTVLVSPGTYKENLVILGAGITVKSEQGPQKTILDGNHAAPVVIFKTGSTLQTTLQGFTIQNGFTEYDSFSGAGVSVERASATLRGNIIRNNESSYWGGGVLVATSPGCLITGNTITNNKAENSGAGIMSYFSSPTIEDNTISQNTGAQDGGGLQIGGDSSAIVRHNTITDNASTLDGGGILLWNAGSASILLNTITGNTAMSVGGGIAMVNFNYGTVISTNLIANNTSYAGGGISWSNPPGAIEGNTIVGNTAQKASGLLAVGFVGDPRVTNNVIAASSGQSVVSCDYLGYPPPNPVFRFNNVFSPQGAMWAGDTLDQTGVNGNISSDPVFVDPKSGDFHLSPHSPCIDAGDNTSQYLPDTDFDGKARIVDGTSLGRAIVDLGVYEVQAPKIVSVSADGKNLLVAGQDFDSGATILLNGMPEKTSQSNQSPSTALTGKKLLKLINHGQTVVIKVRNLSGASSNEVDFTRP